LLPLRLLWAAAKVHLHLSHLQSHLEDDWLLVAAAAAVDVAVVHDVAAIIAAAFAGAVLLVAADADAAAAAAAVSVAVPELSVVVSKHHLTYNLLQWLK
jgi:hypothetical protein